LPTCKPVHGNTGSTPKYINVGLYSIVADWRKL